MDYINDPHFHVKSKGCILEKRVIKSKTSYGVEFIGKYCTTHQVEVCRCGFEFGWHFGKDAHPKTTKDGRLTIMPEL